MKLRELLAEARPTVIVGLVLLVTFAAGAFYGHRVHPGEVLVPAETGSPSDLPGWACDELVRRRLEDYWQGVDQREAHRPRWRGIIVHHADAWTLRALLGPRLGECPR